MSDESFRLLLAGLVALVGAVLLWQSTRDQVHRRHVTDLPTSRAKGVFVGLNEVVGTAVSASPLSSRFDRIPCVWFVYREQTEMRRVRNDGGRERTETVWVESGRGGEMIPFAVEDETGRVAVHPEGAEFRGTVVVDEIVGSRGGGGLFAFAAGSPGPTGRFKRYEAIIPVGATVYVLGTARLVDDGRRPQIAAEPGEPFFITTRREDQLARMFRWRAVAASVGAIVAGAGAAVLVAGPTEPAGAVVPAVIGGLAVVGAIAVISVTLVHNGLVRLRQREERAWSLIDVQLRRRHDLIPRLVAAATAVAGHERGVQTRVAGIRSEAWTGARHEVPDDAEVRDASVVATGQAAAARSFHALVEAYPQLTADAAFAELFDQLVDSEDRVALARGFFNESVTALRIRAQTFPASLVARAMRLGGRELFTLDGDPG